LRRAKLRKANIKFLLEEAIIDEALLLMNHESDRLKKHSAGSDGVRAITCETTSRKIYI
jgi:hypothetical protein